MEQSRRTERVNYKALHNLSSADLVTSFKGKKKAKPGSKVYQVERLISMRKVGTRDAEYLVKWKDWPLWTSSWEPSAHLSNELIRGYNNPCVSIERLEKAAVVFSEAILGILKCRAVKATYSAEISFDHDVLRYIFKGQGKGPQNGVSMLYEKDDLKRFCLPSYWYCYLDQLGQGATIDFPLKLKPVLRFSKKRFIVLKGEIKQAPLIPVEKLIIVVNRRACDGSTV
ncbi:uncharacterized protein [Montipora foliosa]|uniref:uncharacterized protein n=1 Tax=Montipora foliosa TaxID=591990 RepID=UPI0035F1E8B8